MSRMTENTRLMWRALRDAGSEGMTLYALRALMDDKLDPWIVQNRLRDMRRLGYTKFHGTTRSGLWTVGEKVPFGESPTLWASGVPGLAESHVVHDQSRREARKASTAFTGRVNSVWALAQATKSCA